MYFYSVEHVAHDRLVQQRNALPGKLVKDAEALLKKFERGTQDYNDAYDNLVRQFRRTQRGIDAQLDLVRMKL